jgi:5'-methylthioadenosine phosphorylase
VKQRAEVGVFGGSGFYRFFDKSDVTSVQTPYGRPSAQVAVSTIAGKRVAFLPRHGAHHEYPPQAVPYRANVFAFKRLGATRVIAPITAGSLRPEVEPGDLVFCDQFVNFTTGRMRKVAMKAAQKLGLRFHRSGTLVVIQGPRFSTRAESRFFRSQGWDVINMTQYPEVVLARELELCYLNISLVTDYDAGLEGDPKVKPVSHEQVVRVFKRNQAALRNLIVETVKSLPERRGCDCATALKHARLSA